MPVDEWRRVIFPADEDAAVAIANDSQHGPGDAVVTHVEHGPRVASRIETGTRGSTRRRPDAAPFADFKRSGFGREQSREELN